MTIFFWILNFIFVIILPIAIFVIAYFVIKKAVKNGTIEAYKEIHKDSEGI